VYRVRCLCACVCVCVREATASQKTDAKNCLCCFPCHLSSHVRLRLRRAPPALPGFVFVCHLIRVIRVIRVICQPARTRNANAPAFTFILPSEFAKRCGRCHCCLVECNLCNFFMLTCTAVCVCATALKSSLTPSFRTFFRTFLSHL